ncbi:MAG: cell division protein FtsA [bacterium]|nr:cell division protein FtsA [bacterium]
MAKTKQNLIVGLDIGTTQVRTLIAEIHEDGEMSIIGIGTVPSEGLERGMIVDLESTTRSIQRSVQKAQDIANVEVKKAIVGISGNHIQCQNARAGIEVVAPLRGITEEDVARAREKAMAMVTPAGREIIHTLVQEYIVDEQSGIKNPIGFAGTRLDVEIHVVTGALTSANNIAKSVNQAGVEVEDIVLQPLASSRAILNDDERDLGVIMADIGGGTTDVVIFGKNGIRHTQIIPLGGNYITKDIAEGLRVTRFDAENIKRKYGCAYVALVGDEEQFEINDVVGREPQMVERKKLAEIIQPRMEEIYTLIKEQLDHVPHRYRRPAGVVLTGGVTLMPGVKELAKEVFQLPIRIGAPFGIRGLTEPVSSPIYSTGVGLLLFGYELRLQKPLRRWKWWDKISGWLNNF